MKLGKILQTKLKIIYGDSPKVEIVKRLNDELNKIKEYKYEDLFYQAHLIAKKSHSLGYSLELRGSGNNSFVAYLLEITDVNSYEFNLPFEILINNIKEPYFEFHVAPIIYNEIIEYSKEINFSNNIYTNVELEKIKTIKNINLNDKDLIRKTYKKLKKQFIDDFVPTNFDELVKVFEISLGEKEQYWENNGKLLYQGLTEFGQIEFLDLITNKEQVYTKLVNNGVEKEEALKTVFKIKNNKKIDTFNISDWYKWSLERIDYLWSKGHSISYIIRQMKIVSL